MKFIFALFILMIAFQNVKAYEVLNYTELSKSNVYQNMTKVTCQEGEEVLCNYMCGNKTECLRPEMQCVNCAGTSDMFLRLLFTRPDQNFKSTNQAWGIGDFNAYLSDERYVLVSYKSIYNFHKAWGSPEIANNFKNFCPKSQPADIDPLFIVAMNDNDQPARLTAVICHDLKQRSYAITIETKIEPKQNSQEQSLGSNEQTTTINPNHMELK